MEKKETKSASQENDNLLSMEESKEKKVPQQAASILGKKLNIPYVKIWLKILRNSPSPKENLST